jgi:hypothetical protein
MSTTKAPQQKKAPVIQINQEVLHNNLSGYVRKNLENILSSSNGYVGKNRVIGAAARQLKKREQIFPFLGCLLTVHVI